MCRRDRLVADGPHLAKLDGGQGVGGDGETRHAEGGQPLHQGVVELSLIHI